MDKSKIFSMYNEIHVKYLDNDDKSKLEWFIKHFEINYLPILKAYGISKNASILEIGCNKGFLLKAFEINGFKNLTGVDLSTTDIEIAQKLVKNASLYCEDAMEFLKLRKNKFDLIVLKAVLEHVEKDKLFKMLNLIKEGLKCKGVVIIEVPNMDWFFAQHERYMDFTHEVGFTRESLAQIMRLFFDDVKVRKAYSPILIKSAIKQKIYFAGRFMITKILNLIFKFIDGGGHQSWWDVRAIIGYGTKGCERLEID